MKKLIQYLVFSAMTIGLGLGSSLTYADSTRVVYHIDDAAAQGLKGLRNIRNHLDVSPQTKDRKSTRLNSSHSQQSRMPSSA